jgi:hypothetical protein
MFVPIDNLYDFLDQFIDEDVIIYRFYPHGSKKLSNLSKFKTQQKNWRQNLTSIPLIMHDQEPLNFKLYKHTDPKEMASIIQKIRPAFFNLLQKCNLVDYLVDISKHHNLEIFNGEYLADRWLLCQSEKNSLEMSKYESLGAIGVYWWCHALIARDWYRYACVDKRLTYPEGNFLLDFNVYNRAWAGSREYRLKFTDMIIENNLVSSTAISLKKLDNDQHYQNHVFENPKFIPKHDLSILKSNQSESWASANYSHDDYIQSAIDVVLETLFDDTRIHLTEKTLRPIACGKPFILVSTPGCLRYLRDYGFETFGEHIDESYDNISDPIDRLSCIIQLMTDIHKLSKNQKINLYNKLHQIAEKNKKWFWSNDFAQKIVSEFQENYFKSYNLCKSSQQGKKWHSQTKTLSLMSDEYRKQWCSIKEVRPRDDIIKILKQVCKHIT